MKSLFLISKTLLRSIGGQILRSLERERRWREVGGREKMENTYFVFLTKPWTDTIGKWCITFSDLSFFELESRYPWAKCLVPDGTLPRPGSKLSVPKHISCLGLERDNVYRQPKEILPHTLKGILLHQREYKNVLSLCISSTHRN